MTPIQIGASTGVQQQNVGEGIAWLPPSPQVFNTHRYYNRRVAQMMDDLLDFDPKDEREVLLARGSLNNVSSAPVGGSVTPAVGKAQAKLLPEAALIAAGNSPLLGSNATWIRGGSSGALTLRMTGVVPADEWTTVLFANPRASDLVTLNTSQQLLSIASDWQQQVVIQYTASSTTAGQLIASLYYWDFVQNLRPAWQATINLVVGDFPAATATPICVSFDATGGLILTAGATLKQAAPTLQSTPVAGRLMPWTGTMQVGPTSDQGVDVTVPKVGRWSNNAALFGPDAGLPAGSGIAPGAAWRFKSRPKLTISAGSTGGAWPKRLGGICASYAGNQLSALSTAGCPLLRLAETDDQASQAAYATITTLATLQASTATQRANGGGATPGASLGMDFSHFDAYVLSVLNAGIDIHGMIGYTPFALQNTGLGARGSAAARYGPPASNADYALWASAIVGRYLYLQSQATGGGKVIDFTFWNEPDLGTGVWNSAVDQNAAVLKGNGTVTGTAVTNFIPNGGQVPQNGMGILVPGAMAPGVPTISAVAGTNPYSFTLSAAGTNGTNVFMRGLPANFATTYLTVYQRMVADQAAAGNATPPFINGPDGTNVSGVKAPSSGDATTQPFAYPFWEACAYAAKGVSLTLGAVCLHDYSESIPFQLGANKAFSSVLAAPFPSATPRITEWGMRSGDVAAWYYQSSGANWDDKYVNTMSAAFIHSYLAEMLASGADMGAYFAPWGISANTNNFPGSLFDVNSSSGRPTPTFGAFALLWKHHATLTTPLISTVSSSWPNLRGLCSVATNATGKTVVTLSYSSWRPGGGTPRSRLKFDLDWSAGGLPASFTWKQWQVDETNVSRFGTRLPLISQDQSSNAPTTLPFGGEIDWLGVGCVQIVQS